MSHSVMESIKIKLKECERHVGRIYVAKEHLKSHFPLTLESYGTLNDIDESFIDQLIYRFSKLQDTMGEGVFPRLLELMLEDVKGKTFLDRLHRLEELSLVDKSEWLLLREIRNTIAHEYSDNENEIIEGINQVYNQTDTLIKIFIAQKRFLEKRL